MQIQILCYKIITASYFCATKISKNTIGIWNYILFFMINLHIKLTLYIQKNKFTSDKQYSFGLIFSESPKKTHGEQVCYKFCCFVWKETNHEFLQKTFAPVCLLLLQLVLMFFIPCDTGIYTLFLIKLFYYPEVS